jgi:hypothetical protein
MIICLFCDTALIYPPRKIDPRCRNKTAVLPTIGKKCCKCLKEDEDIFGWDIY